MIELLKRIFQDFITITNEMSVYLLLGFLLTGLLKVFFTKNLIYSFSKPSFLSVVYASIFGIPLPLCSCGVIPTGISLYENGASKGATVSFLTSTPQTGVDSILITSSILGLPFAIIRVIVSFFAGIVSGVFVNHFDKNTTDIAEKITLKSDSYSGRNQSKIRYIFSYAFVEFFRDIAKWLLIGLIISAVISALIPDDFFMLYADYKLINTLAILLASIPMYVCATGSIPIAAMLMMKGLSPGLAFIFLMAGPATNAAAITVIGKILGRKTLAIYIVTIVLIAITFGLMIDSFLPGKWFYISTLHELQHHAFIPHFVKVSCSILFFLLIVNALYLNFKSRKIASFSNENSTTYLLTIEGMTCKICKRNVEKAISAMPNVKKAVANVEAKKLYIESDRFNLSDTKNVLEKLGYKVVKTI